MLLKGKGLIPEDPVHQVREHDFPGTQEEALVWVGGQKIILN